MFRHLLKLIWKRKTRNMMLSLEILLAFVIVFAIAAAGLRNYQLYQLPTGFDRKDVWAVEINGAGGYLAGPSFDTYDQFKRGLLSLPGVQQVAFVTFAPYMHASSHTNFTGENARQVSTEITFVSDDFFSLLGIKVIKGRPFDHRDEGAVVTPVVINRRIALEMFGTTDVLGKQFNSEDGGKTSIEMKRVVGVIEDYRKKGEFDAPANMVIARHTVANKDGPRSILIKMAPGTPRAFEKTLSRQLKLLNNGWTYRIVPLEALRASAMHDVATPLVVLAVIAAFLLLMVAFGLFGVLWQNTTRRIPEIGLRRAIGANTADIYRQIIAEQFLLSSGAMLIALLLLVQLPITGALGDGLNWPVFLAAAAVSMAVIYLLSLLCSVYPGWRASRMSPTEALHYE